MRIGGLRIEIVVKKLSSCYNDLGYECSSDAASAFEQCLAKLLPGGAYIDKKTNTLKCKADDVAAQEDLKANFQKYCAKARRNSIPPSSRKPYWLPASEPVQKQRRTHRSAFDDEFAKPDDGRDATVFSPPKKEYDFARFFACK